MSQLSTTTTTASPILQVVNNYLSTVKTSSGKEPDQATKDNFINQCIAYELNPIKRQAYLTGYDSKDGATFTFIVGIDGFTSIAARTGAYAGKDQARFSFNGDKLDSASVTVYRIVKGIKCAFSGQAFYDESVQTKEIWENSRKTGKFAPNSMWAKMPRTMLEKCAFAKALRSAFPESLSGMYTSDEIASDDHDTVQAVDVNTVQPQPPVVDTLRTLATKDQSKLYYVLLDKLSELDGRSPGEIDHSLKQKFTYSDFDKVETVRAGQLIEVVQEVISQLLTKQHEGAQSSKEELQDALLDDQSAPTKLD